MGTALSIHAIIAPFIPSGTMGATRAIVTIKGDTVYINDMEAAMMFLRESAVSGKSALHEDEAEERLQAAKPALLQQLANRLPGEPRLPNIRTGSLRKARNNALHSADWDGTCSAPPPEVLDHLKDLDAQMREEIERGSKELHAKHDENHGTLLEHLKGLDAQMREEIERVSKEHHEKHESNSDTFLAHLRDMGKQLRDEMGSLSLEHHEKHDRNSDSLMQHLRDLDSQMKEQIERVSREHHERHDTTNDSLLAQSRDMDKQLREEMGHLSQEFYAEHDKQKKEKQKEQEAMMEQLASMMAMMNRMTGECESLKRIEASANASLAGLQRMEDSYQGPRRSKKKS